jgi:hypothetical protein
LRWREVCARTRRGKLRVVRKTFECESRKLLGARNCRSAPNSKLLKTFPNHSNICKDTSSAFDMVDQEGILNLERTEQLLRSAFAVDISFLYIFKIHISI